MKSILTFLFVFHLILLANGCTRTRYRLAADRDSQRILDEKANCSRLEIPQNYAVTPDPRSRFYDPTNPDCPQLPVQQPVLYGYQIPELNTSQSTRNSSQPAAQPIAPLNEATIPSSAPEASPNAPSTSSLPLVIPVEQPVYPASFLVQPVQETVEVVNPLLTGPPPEGGTTNGGITNGGKRTIPASAWEVLPPNCIPRMLEFASMRSEHAMSFPSIQMELPASDVRRLTLDNLMELAMINSREYQTRKEVLYRAALSVTRQRYRFELNPTPFGNGTAANYRHLRNDGKEVNTLGIPSSVGVQQSLASGGEFLARFANNVVLTFNGTSGFASDIGSELVFDFQQTIFQRDVRFESLTQSERDVVYATRDYIRFRKQLFRDIANQYYNLLLNYRIIEINAQDYFTNLRGFLQSQAEYRTAEKIPRIQVDQFEQNVLRTRSNLVTNTFTLEAALDLLKFRLGLPPELPIYLDLTELESISLKDELSVARQMISRARVELLNARGTTALDATSLANVAEVLAERMMNILVIQQRIQAANKERPEGHPSIVPDQNDNPNATSNEAIGKAVGELEQLQQMLQILGARLQFDLLRSELDLQLKADLPVPPLRILIRAIDSSMAELLVIDLALKIAIQKPSTWNPANFQSRRDELGGKLGELIAYIDQISTRVSPDIAPEGTKTFEKIPDRMKESVALLTALEELAKQVTRDILPVDGKSVEKKVQSTVDATITLSDQLLKHGPDGWEEIRLDGNEAMLTALVQRLDLKNQRGDLADAWRQIKLAGDDLRSIVDLRATQFLRTNSDDKDPFDLSFDDSETRLSVALDTPLNRRLQRNNFRIALINYNVGLRNLIAAEDNIKLDVREDLRQLQLDRNQYTIAVASAALAYERVISTRLRLQYAVQNVTARDFLEAQQAYTNALSTIARQHVNYITDRTELFFDLEAFDVDPFLFWSGVRQDDSPPINVDFPSTNPTPYDCLPSRVWYSPTVRQMESIPPGPAIIGHPY